MKDKKTKDLIEWLRQWDENYKRQEINEIIQRLVEYEELKRLLLDAVDPLLDIYEYVLGLVFRTHRKV